MISIEGAAMGHQHETDAIGTKEGSPPAVPSAKDAVKALYAAFAGRPRPRDLAAAATKDAAFVAGLLAVPLAEIEDHAILRYSLSAMTTIGTEDDFAYFLPRLLEVAVGGPAAGLADPWIIAGKLGTAGWRTWVAAEQEAVEAAFRAAFVRLRAVHPDDEEAFPWLDALLRAEIDPRPALADWTRDVGAPPLLQLAACVVDLAARLRGGTDGFPSSVALHATVDWFVAQDLAAILIERVSDVAAEDAYRIDAALDALPALEASSRS